MKFGRAFYTRNEADKHLKKIKGRGDQHSAIRKISQKLHPRRNRLFHVGTRLDFLNFA